MGCGQRLMAREGLELVRGAAEAGAQPLTQSRGDSLSKALRSGQSVPTAVPPMASSRTRGRLWRIASMAICSWAT